MLYDLIPDNESSIVFLEKRAVKNTKKTFGRIQISNC